MSRKAASPSKSKACKAATSAPNSPAAWSTPVGISPNSVPSASAWKISSCNLPPRKPNKKETRSEKHTPHLPQRNQELFRIAHRLSADGVFRPDLRIRLLHRHAGFRPLQLPVPDDGPAATHERE